MSRVPSARVRVLSCLASVSSAKLDVLLPDLKKKDLVRLVGLLQQSMLEEQRRFEQLSQCLQALDASKSTTTLDSAIGRKNSEPRDTEDDADDSASNVRTLGESTSPHSTTNGPSSLMEAAMVSSVETGGSRPSSGGSFAELTLFQPFSESGQYSFSDESEFGKRLSVQWDNARIIDDGDQSSRMNGAILRVPIGNGVSASEDEDATADDLEMRMRVEQEHREYLARELCLSQSRLAQLCAKNMKIVNLQQQRRRLYGVEDYQSHSPSKAADSSASDDSPDQSQQLSPPQTVQPRKSLSTLHKERKLKELSEIPSNGSATESPSRAILLRQQAFQSVLTDIFAGNGHSSSPIPLLTTEISPESGYNSSSSLKSPLSINVTGSATLPASKARQILVQLQQSPPKQNDVELRASRERILEQVRSRRASAPPVQHLSASLSSSSRASTLSPQPSSEQRPLKSILKKRPPENGCSRSVDNGFGQSDRRPPVQSSPVGGSSAQFGARSASYPAREESRRKLDMSDEKQRESTGANGPDESKIAERIQTLSVSATTTPIIRQHTSPVPLMAHHPGPSESVPALHAAIPDSPESYSHHIDYPSPVRNGGSIATAVKHGDLPDVVIMKLGSTTTSSQSPRSSFENSEISRLTAAASPKPYATTASSPRHQVHLEKPRPLAERQKTISREEDTAPIPESDAFREWDPRPLLRDLYTIQYEARPEEKRQRFVNMEGHLEHLPMNMRAVVASETMWRTRYFRTREGRLQWFEDANTDTIPFGEMMLASAEVDLDKNACIFVVNNAKEEQLLTVRYPSHLLEKWRASLLSHASASSSVNFVRPVYPVIPHPDENVCIIEIGSCSIRAGLLTAEPSLPQSYFPSVACVLPDGNIVPGVDALSPSVRHHGMIVHPITPTQLAVSRYSMDLEVVRHLIRKVFDDLQIEPRSYQIMLSVPQNAPVAMVGDVMRTLLTDFGVRGVFVSRQPFLILYAYDVTTGVVVDFGDRLNIVPVIDGYVVQSAIVSLPYGGHNVSEGMRTKLIERNWTPYSFMSEVERYILRYVMEKTCYVAADFDEEAQRYDHNPSGIDTHVSIELFEPTKEMPEGYNVDASRFTSPEGIFKPKRWGFDIDGLHKLIYHAIQGSPLDSRRILYRNIYLAGGASLIPGLVERLELELAPLVASSVQVRVRTSPWRDHAAYIGAQILAGGIQFEQQLIKDTTELEKFIRRLYNANF